MYKYLYPISLKSELCLPAKAVTEGLRGRLEEKQEVYDQYFAQMYELTFVWLPHSLGKDGGTE